MKKHLGLLLILIGAPLEGAAAADSIYCPQNSGYINTGMTIDQVISACGQPTSVTQSKQAAVQRFAVTQLIYTNLDKGAMYSGYNSTYQIWSLPSGSTQMQMQVNVMNNKVSSISINGNNSNASTLCKGQSIQIGSDPNEVYSACGSPTQVNQTYIEQPVPGNPKPQTWVYNGGPYQPSITLTFINGILQSIN